MSHLQDHLYNYYPDPPRSNNYSEEPVPLQIDNLLLDRDQYFLQKAIDLQNQVVNVKSTTTLTSEAFVWTYRTTNCDVISIITTAVPIRDGYMKDINIESHEPKRLKPPNVKKSIKDTLGSTPYDIGLSVDMNKKRKKLNKMLQDERKEFMNKLNLTRFIRSKIEEKAILKIQSIYRGYYIRNNLEEIKHYCSIHKMIRSNVRSYLESESYPTSTIAEYRQRRQHFRQHAVKLIQSSFKRYLSRQCLRRRRLQKRLLIVNKAAITIQSLVRGVIARNKVRFLLEKKKISLKLRSVIKLQSLVRKLFAKRRVINRRYKLHWLAARMIQSWYRAKYSRKMAKHIKEILYLKRANYAATLFQNVVRSFLSKRRVHRIRLRKVWSIIMRATIKIQTMIRKFLGKIFVQKKRKSVEKIRMEKLQLEQWKQQQEQQEKENKENQLLLDSANLFLQAQKGNTIDVEDIYLGLIGGEEHTPTEVDENEDTLLTISASVGNLDLLRKCLLLWGFNINHRNRFGQTAVISAAKNHHILAVQYLLSFHPNHPNYLESEAAEKLIQLDLSPEDIGFLFIQATIHGCQSNPIDLSLMQSLIALGLDVNAAAAASSTLQGITAMHAVCEIGNPEMFKYLHIKLKGKIDIKDELQQFPLHRAVTSNIILVKWILGLDPNYQSYMSNETRMENLTALDIDGKDCLLLAILAGKTEIVHLLELIIANQGAYDDDLISGDSGKHSTATTKKVVRSAGEEVAWSNQDIIKANELVEKSNSYCLHKLINGYGFDVNWTEETTNRSLAMIACWVCDVDILELLLQKHADFSLLDNNSETIFHYAMKPYSKYPLTHPPSSSASSAFYKKKEGLLAFLLSHALKGKCKITPSLLTQQSKETKENCFHIAARDGLEVNIDLLIDSTTTQTVMSAMNHEGMTPFMIACLYYQEKIIYNYLRMGSNVHHEDHRGNNCFWYLFHPNKTTILNHRRVYGSEYILQASTSISRKERDEEMTRIQNEIQLITLFLRNGCHLYTKLKTAEDHSSVVTPERLKEILTPRNTSTSTTATATATATATSTATHEISYYEKYYDQLEPGDILLYEYSYTLFRMIIPNLISRFDAWRLLLASIRLDDGNLKFFVYLLKCGILDVISNDHLLQNNVSVEVTNDDPSSPAHLNALVVDAAHHGAGNSFLSLTSPNAPTPASAASRNKSHRQQSLDKHIHRTGSNSTQPTINTSSNINLTQLTLSAEQIMKLQDLYYNQMTIIAWVIRLHHLKIFSYFLKKFSIYYNYTLPVDQAQVYPLLHYIAIHGTGETMDVLLTTIHSINTSIESATTTGGLNISTNNNNNLTDENSVNISAFLPGDHSYLKKIFLRYESYNQYLETPFMLASKYSNFSVIKKYYQLKVNLRNALNGRWNGWVYAFVKRLESKEKLTQTGRYGRDEELYFNFQTMKEIKDFPVFTIWFS